MSGLSFHSHTIADPETELDEQIVKQWRERKAGNTDKTEATPSLYEQMVPKNESRFMCFLRDWERKVGFVTPLLYKNILLISVLHLGTLAWSAYYLLRGQNMRWQTWLYLLLMTFLAGFGVTGGVHRLWTHKCYKAKTPLKLLMLFLFTIAGQNTVYHWVRNHRTHHKGSDTESDPHDATRGLFFSHCGWLMMMRHPRVLEEGLKIDMSDIENDPILRFHSKYYPLFQLMFCLVIPGMIPALLWGEDWGMSVFSQTSLRYVLSLNMAWSVNSLAHKYGSKPYNKDIKSTDSKLIALISIGEGWHNYHHTFPWDYKAAELPYDMNPTTLLIDFFASLGWVYDRKTASPDIVQKYVQNYGDGKLA